MIRHHCAATALAALIAALCPAADGDPAQAAVTSTAPSDALDKAPFQPYPPEGPPRTQSRLSEPFYIWLESPTNEGEVLEGDEVVLRWRSGGPIRSVRLYYEYERCRLAGRSRGSVGKVIGGGLLPNTGEYSWTVPWMDTYRLRLRIAGYDAQGARLSADAIGLFYRSRQLAGLSGTFIGVVKERQRLYYYVDGKARRMHIVSTAMSGYATPNMTPGSYDRRRGQMGQVFSKARSVRSRLYNCTMPYWMAVTSSGSHGIHATSPNFYSRLGRPASHGCIRQHAADAKVLYSLVAIGTPVYVF